MKSRGHQPRLLCLVLPSLTAITTMSLCYCARDSQVIVFDWIFIFSTGWSSKTSFTQARASSSSPSPSTASWMGGLRNELWHLLFLLLMSLISWESVRCWIVIFVCDAVSDFPGCYHTYTSDTHYLSSDICFKLLITFLESKSGTSTQKLLFIHSFLRKIAISVMCLVLVKNFVLPVFYVVNIIYANLSFIKPVFFLWGSVALAIINEVCYVQMFWLILLTDTYSE